MILNRRKKYLQIALNGTLADARSIIEQLPTNDRILIEAGTPLIKEYGAEAIKQLKDWFNQKIYYLGIEQRLIGAKNKNLFGIAKEAFEAASAKGLFRPEQNKIFPKKVNETFSPYIVADLKAMDRGDREAEIAARHGASAAICLGLAPIETINSFIASCAAYNIDSMLDMMNVEYPVGILRQLKKQPDVVIVHRGVDEEKFNREKMIPLHEIRRIKGAHNIMISVAGGDTVREVQRAIFNDADIVIVWKEFYQSSADTAALAKEFLKEIR